MPRRLEWEAGWLLGWNVGWLDGCPDGNLMDDGRMSRTLEIGWAMD